jgi:hypothetical protein
VEEKALFIDCPEEGRSKFLLNRVLNSYFIIFNTKIMESTWNSLWGEGEDCVLNEGFEGEL